MSTPVSGNQYFTTLESNPKSHTMLKSTTLKVGGTAYINFLESKGAHLAGDLLVDGNLTVKDTGLLGSVFEQDLTVDGATVLNSTLLVPNDLSTLQSLLVVQDLQVNGDVFLGDAAGDVTVVNGLLSAPNALSTLNELDVTTDLEVVTGNLTVTAGTLDVPAAKSTLNELEVTTTSLLLGVTSTSGIVRRASIIDGPTTLGDAESDAALFFRNTTGGTYAVTLPLVSASIGNRYRLNLDTALPNTVTIDAAGADTMTGVVVDAGLVGSNAFGPATVQITANLVLKQGDYIELHCNGVTWLVSGVESATAGFT